MLLLPRHAPRRGEARDDDFAGDALTARPRRSKARAVLGSAAHRLPDFAQQGGYLGRLGREEQEAQSGMESVTSGLTSFDICPAASRCYASPPLASFMSRS